MERLEHNQAPTAPVADEKPNAPSSHSSASLNKRHQDADNQVLQELEKEPHPDEDVGAPQQNDVSSEPTTPKQPNVNNVSSIPNGGTWAWLQVLGAFFLLFNSWGIINTFGTYQAYYETNLLASSSPSAISWVGSIQAFLLLFVGALSGPIYDAGYFRALLVMGTVFLVLGQMMLSLCKEYWQVLLSQAICIGIGCGCLFIPSVAILSTYFTTRFAFAVGLASSGSSLGGVIYPIVFHKLLPQIGFAWATRVIGFIILGTMLIPNACMRVRVLPVTRRSLVDVAAFRKPAYSLVVFGFFIGFMGLYMPFFYAQVMALEKRITNENLAFYLLAIMNSTSIFGRIIPNYMADKLGPLNVFVPCALVTSILCFCFIAVSSSAGIIVLMAFYGFFSGSFVTLPPAALVHLSLDARDKIGTRMGQGFAIIALGLLVGTPIGGAILDQSGFVGVWVFGGVLLAAAGVTVVMARVSHKGWNIMIKA